jgi:hypothetical protein
VFVHRIAAVQDKGRARIVLRPIVRIALFPQGRRRNAQQSCRLTMIMLSKNPGNRCGVIQSAATVILDKNRRQTVTAAKIMSFL